MNIKSFVVDASVAGDWLFSANISRSVAELEAKAFSMELVAPRLLTYEISNLITQLMREQSVSDFKTAVETFDNWGVVYDDGAAAMQEIIELAHQHGLTAYDAAYLEVAFRRKLPLATTDKRLAKAARKLGVETLI